jgi:5-methylthioadenosine/S-adenosylhomocysteine deaminase
MTDDRQNPQACDLLLRNALILSLDDADTIHVDAALAIEADRICAIGPEGEVRDRWRARREIDCRGAIVMPGFVNVHNHTPLMITRGMVEDLGFAPMYVADIPQGHHLDEEDTYRMSLLGAYELLRAGSTTVMDFYRNPAACARAHAEIGLRSVIAGRIHDADPEALSRGRYEYDLALGRASIAENAALIEQWNGFDNGRIRCDWAPHAPDTCSDDLLREVAGLVDAHGGNIHTHLAQSATEVAMLVETRGRTSAQTLDHAGLLDARTIAAHCIWLDEADIARIGAAGVTVAHSPIGNAKSGTIAPITALAQAGARIALCSDTMSGDMFEALRWAVSMQRIRTQSMVLDARAALRWATREGARALGLDDEIGALTVGRKADIVILDRTSPMLAPVVDGYGILAYSANGACVDTVIIDGRVVIEEGRLTTLDGGQIVARAQSVSDKLWMRAGRAPIHKGRH